MRVLLIDDDPDDLLIQTVGLEGQGFDVIVCDRPDHAVALVAELAGDCRTPDAILVDAKMPCLDGQALAPRLARFGIPIAIMSGSEFFKVDGYPFIEKPCGDCAEFAARIRALAGPRWAPSTTPRPAKARQLGPFPVGQQRPGV